MRKAKIPFRPGRIVQDSCGKPVNGFFRFFRDLIFAFFLQCRGSLDNAKKRDSKRLLCRSLCRRRKTVPRLFGHTSPVNSTSETADVSELTRVESAIEREKIRCERGCVRGPRPFPNPFLATGAPGSGTSATHAGAHARDGVPNRVLPSPTRENARRVAERALGSHTPAVHIYVPALGESPSRRLSRFSRRRRVCFPRDERARGGPQGIRPVQGGDDQVRVLRSPQARRPEGADGTSARPFPARASLPPRATPPPNSRSVALRRGVEFSSLPPPFPPSRDR